METTATGLAARPSAAPDERALVAGLRAGDEAAFAILVDRHHAALVRVALLYVADRATAEEVTQETWLAVVEGIGRFEGRSSLKTWLFRILANRARTRGAREARSVPFSAFGGDDPMADEPVVDPDRFFPPGHEDAGHWSSPPHGWSREGAPEGRLLAGEVQAVVRAAIADLPPRQRRVIALRDVEGWSAAEVCNALGLTETNGRVLLHRARSKVRLVLERAFAER